MKRKPRSVVVLCILLLVILSIIPTVISYPFKQASSIELNYAFLDGNLTSSVDIEFSGGVSEWQHRYYSLFFVLIGAQEGYRHVTSTVTLLIGDFNDTKDADFSVSVSGARNERTYFVVMKASFDVQQRDIISHVVNGTLSFQANYELEISGYEHIFEDEMTGTAIVKIAGVQDVPDDEEPTDEIPDDEIPDDEIPDENGETSNVSDNNVQILSILAITCLIIGAVTFFLIRRKS